MSDDEQINSAANLENVGRTRTRSVPNRAGDRADIRSEDADRIFVNENFNKPSDMKKASTALAEMRDAGFSTK